MEKLIENIEIKNFKSIRQLTMNDCRRINLLIGYPNVGKSNLLEALSLFSIDRSDFDFSSIIRIDDLTSLFHNGEIDTPAEVIINSRYRHSATYSKNVIKFNYHFDKDDSGFELIDKNLGPEAWPVKEFELSGNDLKILDYNPQNIGSENKLPDIKKYVFSKKVILDDSYYWDLRHPNGENIFSIVSKNKELREEVKELFKKYDLNFSFDKTTQSFKILKFVGDDIFLIPYSMIADTLQRLIFYKAAILSNKNSVLLFEEPEAHMFPPYISIFTGDIWYNKENQYFIATHSPFVVNDFMENAKDELAIYLLDYRDGETIVKRLTEEQIHEAYQYGLDLFLNVESLME